MCVQRAKVEVQKQRQVEIVEKILNEEKNLATRKKLQPHLCLNTRKEVVKVTAAACYIISASLYERSAYATGVSRGPSVCPHMRAVATHVDGFLCRLGW